MIRKDIIGEIFVGLGVLITLCFSLLSLYACNSGDGYNCGYVRNWAIVFVVWFAIPLILFGLILFLVNYILKKKKRELKDKNKRNKK